MIVETEALDRDPLVILQERDASMNVVVQPEPTILCAAVARGANVERQVLYRQRVLVPVLGARGVVEATEDRFLQTRERVGRPHLHLRHWYERQRGLVLIGAGAVAG